MTHSLDRITAELADRISSYLEQPDDGARELQALRERVNGLSDRIGTKAHNDACKAITEAEADDNRRARLAEITSALVAACKPLGINLQGLAPAKRPSKKRRRRRKASPSPAPTETRGDEQS